MEFNKPHHTTLEKNTNTQGLIHFSIVGLYNNLSLNNSINIKLRKKKLKQKTTTTCNTKMLLYLIFKFCLI